MLRAYPDAGRIAVVCGGGANGGDGRIAARILREAGRDAVETDDPSGADVVIDALFGTGFHGAPRREAAAVIERIAASRSPVVSVDLPSGVDASTGEVEGAAVEAELTVTFHGSKVGLVVAPGRFHAGRVVVADIGLEPAPTAIVRGTATVLERIPRRGARDTKFSAGSLLVVGGAPGTTSAAVLAATAALRADAGYVTLAVPAGSSASPRASRSSPSREASNGKAPRRRFRRTWNEPRRSRSAPDWDGRARRARSSEPCSRGRSSRRSSTRTGSSDWSPSLVEGRSS